MSAPKPSQQTSQTNAADRHGPNGWGPLAPGLKHAWEEFERYQCPGAVQAGWGVVASNHPESSGGLDGYVHYPYVRFYNRKDRTLKPLTTWEKSYDVHLSGYAVEHSGDEKPPWEQGGNSIFCSDASVEDPVGKSRDALQAYVDEVASKASGTTTEASGTTTSNE